MVKTRRADAAPLRGPVVRELMLARRLPVWRIATGVLIIEVYDEPRMEILQPIAGQIVELADLLC